MPRDRARCSPYSLSCQGGLGVPIGFYMNLFCHGSLYIHIYVRKKYLSIIFGLSLRRSTSRDAKYCDEICHLYYWVKYWDDICHLYYWVKQYGAIHPLTLNRGVNISQDYSTFGLTLLKVVHCMAQLISFRVSVPHGEYGTPCPHFWDKDLSHSSVDSKEGKYDRPVNIHRFYIVNYPGYLHTLEHCIHKTLRNLYVLFGYMG